MNTAGVCHRCGHAFAEHEQRGVHHPCNHKARGAQDPNSNCVCYAYQEEPLDKERVTLTLTANELAGLVRRLCGPK